MIYKTDPEIELMKESCTLVSEAFGYLASLIKPGVTTLQLDRKASERVEYEIKFKIFVRGTL